MTVYRHAIAVGLAAGVLLSIGLVTQPGRADPTGVALTTANVRPADRRVSIRTAPSVSSKVKRVVPTGTRVAIACQVVGGRLGTSTHRDNRTWDRLKDGAYVHDMVTTTARDGKREGVDGGGYVQWTQDVPRCDAPEAQADPGAQAADWAAAQVGQSVATVADLGTFRTDSWMPGPPGEWSGDANKFVAAAWAHAHRTVKGDSVMRQYAAYESRLHQGTPPRGAIVFYPLAGEKGHAAISAGDGTVYSTIGADFHEVPVSRVEVDFFGPSAGWVIP